MKIITMCVDQERGRYIAFDIDRPADTAAFSYTSCAEAVGLLVVSGEIDDVEVVEIETAESLRKKEEVR